MWPAADELGADEPGAGAAAGAAGSPSTSSTRPEGTSAVPEISTEFATGLLAETSRSASPAELMMLIDSGAAPPRG